MMTTSNAVPASIRVPSSITRGAPITGWTSPKTNVRSAPSIWTRSMCRSRVSSVRVELSDSTVTLAVAVPEMTLSSKFTSNSNATWVTAVVG